MQGGEKAPYKPAARINSLGEPPPALTVILRAPAVAWGSSNSRTTGGVFNAVSTAARMLLSSARSPT
jgi:hypothetical protein